MSNEYNDITDETDVSSETPVAENVEAIEEIPQVLDEDTVETKCEEPKVIDNIEEDTGNIPEDSTPEIENENKAARDQFGTPGYRDDEWNPTTIPEGTRLYRLDFQNGDDPENLVSSSYYIDDDAMKDGDYMSFDDDGNQHFNVEKFCDDYQIAPHESGTYKNHLSTFQVPEGGIDAEQGIAENNWEYGHGGGQQLFIDADNASKLQMIDNPVMIDDDLRYVGEDRANDMLGKHTVNDIVYKSASDRPE